MTNKLAAPNLDINFNKHMHAHTKAIDVATQMATSNAKAAAKVTNMNNMRVHHAKTIGALRANNTFVLGVM